jgi:uncharacterized protein (DUF4213/DUF364 family)
LNKMEVKKIKYVLPVLKDSRSRLREIVRKNKLDDVEVSVLVKALTPEEAIGEPKRKDYPILLGKERVIEAEVLNAKAHTFTDSPIEFEGKLREVLDLPLVSNSERAIFIASLNAVVKYLSFTEKTLHCNDEDPVRCADEIASFILNKWGKIKVGLIGLNPAIAESLVNNFGGNNVRITDLNKENINRLNQGVEIWDGHQKTEEVIKQSDLILITGTTFGNDTFNCILNYVQNYRKDYFIYGVTGAGICSLMGLNRICPYGRD